MSTPFKLNQLQVVAERAEDGAWLEMTWPNGEPMFLGGQSEEQFAVKVAGSHSKTYRDITKRHRDEAIKRRGRIDGADMDRREMATLAGCTLEWRGAFDDDGERIPFTKENVTAIYKAAPFIAERVDEGIGDDARFFEKS